MGARPVLLELDPGAAAAARQEFGASGAEVVEGPLDRGAEALGPYDVIVIEGAFAVSPEALIAQLANGGRLVGVDAIMGAPQAALYEKRAGGVSRRALFEAGADLLDGFQPRASFVF